jgi:hypothetical protein
MAAPANQSVRQNGALFDDDLVATFQPQPDFWFDFARHTRPR